MGLAGKAKSALGVMAVGAGLALAGSATWADEAALERCLSRTGAPNAGAPVSEAEGQAYLQAVPDHALARRSWGTAERPTQLHQIANPTGRSGDEPAPAALFGPAHCDVCAL
ncbi:hypothetical protein [Pelagovum sp. HNIBRBA483]|uniref:hypothetical protein n=1 Tax=Pelagovum sp. HNIBRBA483 TaxID=3233341 RepID=UPI0034A23B5E